MLLFYNDKTSFEKFVKLMRSEHDLCDPASPLIYHINLVQLLALCTEGKNVYTEIKCHSLLPLDDIVRVVTHKDCIPEVSTALFHTRVKDKSSIFFLCYYDTMHGIFIYLFYFTFWHLFIHDELKERK